VVDGLVIEAYTECKTLAEKPRDRGRGRGRVGGRLDRINHDAGQR